MKYNPSNQSLTMETVECKVTGDLLFFGNARGGQHLALCLYCIDPATHGACSNRRGHFRIEASNRKEHRYEPGLLPLSCV